MFGYPRDGVGGLDVALEKTKDGLPYVQVRHEEMARPLWRSWLKPGCGNPHRGALFFSSCTRKNPREGSTMGGAEERFSATALIALPSPAWLNRLGKPHPGSERAGALSRSGAVCSGPGRGLPIVSVRHPHLEGRARPARTLVSASRCRSFGRYWQTSIARRVAAERHDGQDSASRRPQISGLTPAVCSG